MDARTRTVADLAWFGGPPTFQEPLHVGRPNLGDRARLLERISDILDRRWLTNRGPYVQDFEQRVATLTGTEHCVAVCNGTVALDLVIRALGLHGEVIVPSLTFIATAHALQWQGIRPVFCDVDPRTLTLDPARVEALIGPHTTGILPVHLFGQACDTDALAAVAKRHNLQLFYDASHAFGCTHQGRPVGGFGAAEVFSFHATKFVHTLEGGAITTNDGDLAARLRRMQNFGFAGYDDVRMLGTNGKMNEFSAAMGVTLLEAIDAIAATNQRHHGLYRAALAGVPGLHLREPAAAERHNWQYVVVEVDAALTGIDRDALVEMLHAENVMARRYFHPGCHRMEPYCTQDPGAGRLLPVTQQMTGRLLCLPTGTAVNAADIGKIAALLRFAVENATEIRRRRAGGSTGEAEVWPAAAVACVTQADNALAAGDLDAAYDALAAAVASAPGHAGLHHAFGNVALQRGEAGAARTAFETSLRLAPDVAVVHADLAAVHAHEGRTDDAVAAAQEALRLDPALATAEKVLAAVERGAGRYDEALARYARILARESGDLDALMETGVCCAEMGRSEEARALFRGVLALDAAHAGARAALAELDPAAAVAVEVPDAGGLDVSILIPVFNRLDLTRDCIDSIHAHSPRGRFEIVVVDNGSTDGVTEYLREQDAAGRLRAILNPGNRGFAHACNQAAAGARGRHLLFLNNDTEVRPGWLEPLVRVLDTDPAAAAVGSKLLFPDGSLQHAGVVLVEDQVSGHGLSPYHIYYREPADLPAAGRPRTYRVLTAACLLLRRAAFVQAGGFDEGYWNGYEDVDLCLKLHVRGWRLVYEPQSVVIHKESQSGPERFRRESDNLTRLRGIWSKTISVDVEIRPDGSCVQTDSRFIRDYDRRETVAVPAPPAADATPLVSVVMVTYNSVHTIRDCLDSVLRHATVPLEVVVVDNASRDATREVLAGYAGRIRTVLSPDNSGFSRGTNAGIRAARGQYIVLLNPDTTVTDGWLERLIAHVQPGVGAVGPTSDYVAGLQKFECYLPARRPAVLTIDGAAALLAEHNAGRAVETKLLIGFCMLVPRAVFEEVGLLDDDLFLGNDDLDLSWRLRHRGYRLVVATDVFVHHEGQVSFKSDPHSRTARLVQESTDALYAKLAAYYGAGQVPPPTELWDIDWFRPAHAVFRPRGRKVQPGLTSIIVLAWNGWEHTQKCLASVLEHTKQPYEIVVVDNGSTDGTVDELRRLVARTPQLRVIANRSNRGFAAGNNQGLAIARGEFVLLLNNDTVVTRGWLARLLRVFEREPRAGIVGPVSNSVSGPQLVPAATYEPGAGLQEYAARWAAAHDGEVAPANRVVGFCLLARSELIDRIGGLDEQFGSGNFEDDDFCLRAAHAGYQARIARDVFIHHTGSQTFKAAKIDYRQSLERNWSLFKTKWNVPAARALEAGYRFPLQPGPGTRLYSPLPDLRAGHRAEMDARWWQEPGVEWAADSAGAGTARRDAQRVEIVVDASPRDAAVLWPSLVQHTSIVCSITLAVPPGAAAGAVRPQTLPADWKFAAVEAAAVIVLNDKLRTSAEPVIVLSPEAVLTSGWLKRLLAALARDPRVAAAGPTTNGAAPPQRIKCDYTGTGKSLRQFAVRRAHRHAKQWTPAAQLDAFCIALRPEAFRGVPLDAGRDLDAALAAALGALDASGWQSGVALDAHVHREPVSAQEHDLLLRGECLAAGAE